MYFSGSSLWGRTSAQRQLGGSGFCRYLRLFSCRVVLFSPMEEERRCAGEGRAFTSPNAEDGRRGGIAASAAAPEPSEGVPDPVFLDDSELACAWQSGGAASGTMFSLVRGQPVACMVTSALEVADGGAGRPLPDAGLEVEAHCQNHRPQARTPDEGSQSHIGSDLDSYQGGYQWRKLPSEYGLHCNSVARAHRRLCKRQAYLMSLLTLKKDIDYGVLLIDGSFMKVHRSAAGACRNGLTPGLSRQKQGIARTKEV